MQSTNQNDVVLGDRPRVNEGRVHTLQQGTGRGLHHVQAILELGDRSRHFFGIRVESGHDSSGGRRNNSTSSTARQQGVKKLFTFERGK
jgi:hypothetical protein